MIERKPKRRTRERILETALALFNEFGEPNVTTQLISDEMGISPGNLYYHFHSKDEIIESLFADFERGIEEALTAPTRRPPNVEDIWLFLHLIFEGIWKFRFLYRDVNELLSRNRILETHFKRIVAHKVDTATVICQGLVATGDMKASAAEIQALAVNMTVVATYWLSFEFVSDPRKKIGGESLARGAFQVMALAAPYLVGRSRRLFEELSKNYLTA
ncbi:MAG: TetR family transcriptional regulator [Rhodocyclales bacterium RIFCSPLOWO2_02_FULL_63_24]|nr:MAG: TetR family transcriptional regulator [Rhodocyclales bacterium RIFCSPLOWO2_02_FULL_63_24]